MNQNSTWIKNPKWIKNQNGSKSKMDQNPKWIKIKLVNSNFGAKIQIHQFGSSQMRLFE